jgi:hypothetical protein
VPKNKKDAPSWSVLDVSGKTLESDFRKQRLARRAAQRLFAETKANYTLKNMKTGETVRFVPYPVEERVTVNMQVQVQVPLDHLDIKLRGRETPAAVQE